VNLNKATLSGAALVRTHLAEADLKEAIFTRANLSGANLSGANLEQANCTEADFSGAILTAARLKGATLQWARLNQADLSGADFRQADLSGSILKGANLSGANLRGANLSQADLSGANLSRALLDQADLSQATLATADLSVASLIKADLSETNLSMANLYEAYLIEAKLSRTILQGADLSEARLGRTTFGDVDLTTVKGLDTTSHYGPSYLDIHTLYRSSGKLSELFLRGAGIPVQWLAAVASGLEMRQPQAFFISYASQDEAFARQLSDDLQQQELICWLASEDIKNRTNTALTLEFLAQQPVKLIVVLSKHAVTSRWARQEIETALALEQRQDERLLFLVQLDETDVSWLPHSRQPQSFNNWQQPEAYQQALAELLEELIA
jgi:uncharacterized protein YjbI with pentapeptide repeats